MNLTELHEHTPGLDPSALGVLVRMLAVADETGLVDLSDSALATACASSRNGLSTRTTRLRQAGLIHRGRKGRWQLDPEFLWPSG